MISAAPVPAPEQAIEEPGSASWARALLWIGAPLCLVGLVVDHLGAQWHGGRFAGLIVLSLLALAAAGVLRRVLGWRLASGLALAWLLAVVFYAGVVPALATMLFASGALALGGLLQREAPPALRIACGLILVAGALGWLLPLPVHYGAGYAGLCLGLAAWQWRALAASWRAMATQWHAALDAAPRAAAFAVLVLGLASTGCWIPTMQADDVVYHLRLPWQLLAQHHYPLDPALHIWALAPWAGDVLQAVPQLIAGAEARGSMNALWLVLTATAVWRIASLLGGTARTAWFAVALYGSLPLTAGLAGSMQSETPTAALLAWLVVLILEPAPRTPRVRIGAVLVGAVLVGGLLALKLSSAVFAVLLLPWALWRHRRVPAPVTLAGACAIALAIGGSSYAYATGIARNPFLPLFNAWFRSPYFDPVNFDDARWHAGFDAALPWNLTFHTDRYLEGFAGGGGFVFVALAGAWVLAFLHRRTAAMALATTALIVAPLIPMQYLRYTFPATVLLLPLLSVTAFRIDPRRAAWLLAGVCVLNLAFQANGFWLLRVGQVKMSIMGAGRDEPAFRARVPERNLIAAIRGTDHGNVLALDAERPYVAELGVRGRSISYYDRSLQRAAQSAEAQADGSAWVDVLHRAGITDVLLRPATTTTAQRAALARLHATRRQVEGDVEWWHVPATKAAR